MRASSQGTVERRECPAHITEALRVAGGENCFGDPNFRVVWGWNRIVPIHGEWEEWEQCVATLRDKLTGYTESRQVTRLVRSVIETRHVPKYLPANCWHLEMWRPPEEYGSPEEWHKMGEEVIQGLTIDTSGPYPTRGEYELCYPLTSDGSSHGIPVMLVADVVAEIVQMIKVGRERFNYQQRRAAIEQRERLKEEGLTKRMRDMLKDGMKPFAGETFVTVQN